MHVVVEMDSFFTLSFRSLAPVWCGSLWLWRKWSCSSQHEAFPPLLSRHAGISVDVYRGPVFVALSSTPLKYFQF